MNIGKIIVVIGVSGVGKTTIAKMLGTSLELPYLDADDFHPESNIQKMGSGQALNDDDRQPWLENINAALKKEALSSGAVLACSALKEKYRITLQADLQESINWVVLKGDYDLIKSRMEARNHFMPAGLLQSQFDTWEEPSYGIKVDVIKSPASIIETVKEIIGMKNKAEIGLIGLGVMGKSLSRNIAGKGYAISVFNRHVDGKEEDVAKIFATEHEEMNAELAFDKMDLFVESLASPKRVFLMVNAGAAVDAVIDQLCELMGDGDIIIDGGNSHYKETERRYHALKEKGIQFIGTGVSGGEEGALKGPSIMPGGSELGYESVGPILQSIAAKDSAGTDCCAFIGKGGSGHFVKMVHNGIEYAEMQLIAEVYAILRFTMGKSPMEISSIFSGWLKTELSSYLLEITADILQKKEGEKYLIDIILDKAGNKGTGSWTTIAACELGVAIPTLTAALFARYQSSQLDTRLKASAVYASANIETDFDLEDLMNAYQLARIVNHHQGYDLIAVASKSYGWDINYKDLSRIWTNGCIIRSGLMEQISKSEISEGNVLMDASISAEVKKHRSALNDLSAVLSKTNISAPCMLSALSYLNGYTEERSLAHIIQAQRDYFGAHTYERVDAPRDKKFHTNWLS